MKGEIIVLTVPLVLRCRATAEPLRRIRRHLASSAAGAGSMSDGAENPADLESKSKMAEIGPETVGSRIAASAAGGFPFFVLVEGAAFFLERELQHRFELVAFGAQLVHAFLLLREVQVFG